MILCESINFSIKANQMLSNYFEVFSVVCISSWPLGALSSLEFFIFSLKVIVFLLRCFLEELVCKSFLLTCVLSPRTWALGSKWVQTDFYLAELRAKNSWWKSERKKIPFESLKPKATNMDTQRSLTATDSCSWPLSASLPLAAVWTTLLGSKLRMKNLVRKRRRLKTMF